MAEAQKEDKLANKKITTRAENYSDWYLDVVEAAELAEHAAVRGCMVIKPYGYAIWETIQKTLDAKFKETGVQNAYFPLFIPKKFLEKEAEHVEGFSPEVAVVTYAGGAELKEPLIVRPTSETIMYDAFSRWVQSYRDLPLLINQWANVVRWEMRPRLFLRTTEFLWQEGHTVHATQEEADERARLMLGIYKDLAEELLAIPVIPGVKSEGQKFAGALRTYSVEAMMQDGKSLQFATSHNLGDNFSKVFGIQFSDSQGNKQFGWQTSWGLSTRSIGALIMVHSDDNGLVLPPQVAPIQIVIVPVWPKENEKEAVDLEVKKIVEEIKNSKNFRFVVDNSDKRPGEKFFAWERKGVPLRLEIGLKDIANNSVVLARRDTAEKKTVKRDVLLPEIEKLLAEIQKNLYGRALDYRNKKIKEVDNLADFKKEIANGNFVLAYWCEDKETEAKIKEETGAVVSCIPLEQTSSEGKCVYSGKLSKRKAFFAKSY
ncbi:MAG TPA: proline--tRNA ligase [Candidatus Paceibacterota bacterium]|nr:proline--tRNA ligase [Candidatus Paceibacterota bacterium]